MRAKNTVEIQSVNKSLIESKFKLRKKRAIAK